MLFSHSEFADTFPLWPEGAPGALGGEDRDIPTIAVTFPEREVSNGAAVVICPGGGYQELAMGHEGHDVAEWFNSLGYTAAVLKYRLPSDGYQHPAPLQDVQRALQMMRSNSKNWNLNPRKIGVFGSSAGGHLASAAATLVRAAEPAAEDPIFRVSSRPDFLVMLYPVTSFGPDLSKGISSKRNLLGEDPPEELVELLSSYRQVTKDTPPSFIVHADDDPPVKAEHSVRFYLALREVGVPAELHIFKQGGHGFGITKDPKRPVDHWPDLLERWLEGVVE